MVATLRQIVKVEAGGIVRVQSDQLHEGTLAEVLITTNEFQNVPAENATWSAFIGVGTASGRSIEEIDKSIRSLRDEWPR